MAESISISNPSSSQIGGYDLCHELVPGCTYLATAPGGRSVVLKMLESDCLLRGQLHPMIKDRLGRVRELAHLGVANLLSAERDGDRVFLVWEYLQGQSLADYLIHAPHDTLTCRDLARQLVVSIETLHGLGLVHGALHARNVIVTGDHNIRITHVSPLLYNDTQVDIDSLLDLLADMDCPWPYPQHASTLQQLAVFLTQPGASSLPTDDQSHDHPKVVQTRRLTVAAAILAIIAGILATWLIWRYTTPQPIEQAAFVPVAPVPTQRLEGATT